MITEVEEEARATRLAIKAARRPDHPEGYDLEALDQGLVGAQGLGRRLQQRRALVGSPSIADRRVLVLAVEALLRAVLEVLPSLVEATSKPGASELAERVRWRALYASEALHSGLATLYGDPTRLAGRTHS
ncbi:MAG: hypothetical protein IPG45_25185 [Deltaproteobacteria bacterium]|jgi:hypothetical protein|nr:hypothetical protein [Deltaproteobacteria bacterium]